MNYAFLLLIVILGSLGLCAVICTIGFWATVGVRYQHKEKVFDQTEQARLNAIILEERKMPMEAQRLRMLAEYSESHRAENILLSEGIDEQFPPPGWPSPPRTDKRLG